MRLLTAPLLLAMLMACSPAPAPGEAPPPQVAWSASGQVADDLLEAEEYHRQALSKAHDYLTREHLLEVPLTDSLVAAQRDRFLETLGENRWLHSQEIAELQEQPQLPRWRAALEGRDLGVAMEVATLVRQRHLAWVEEHGTLAAAPAKGAILATAQAWEDARRGWHPEELEPPLIPMDADLATQALLDARTVGFDPNTQHVPPAMADIWVEGTQRTSEGLGAGFIWKDGEIAVSYIEEDSPAGRDGQLRVGDVLTRFSGPDGRWVRAQPPERLLMFLSQVVDKAGFTIERQGETMEIFVAMPSEEEKRLFSMNKDVVRAHRESWQDAGGALEVARIEVTFFYENGDDGHDAAQDIALALKDLEGQVDLVVLDLRRARGGALSVALTAAGHFANGKPLLKSFGRDNRESVLADPSPGALWSGPIQLWVGPQTASSGEAFAEAVASITQSDVIGWPTFGKGTIQWRMQMDMPAARNQEPSRLGELWITIGELRRADGASLQIHGVALDYLLPGALEEPWGERSLKDAIRPGGTDPASEGIPTLEVSGFIHPSLDDTDALPLWREAGIQAARKAGILRPTYTPQD